MICVWFCAWRAENEYAKASELARAQYFVALGPRALGSRTPAPARSNVRVQKDVRIIRTPILRNLYVFLLQTLLRTGTVRAPRPALPALSSILAASSTQGRPRLQHPC